VGSMEKRYFKIFQRIGYPAFVSGQAHQHETLSSLFRMP